MYQLLTTRRFEQQLERFYRQDKTCYQQIKKVVMMLAENLRHPGMKAKAIKGHKPLMEASANIDSRIVWQWFDDKTILLLYVDHNYRGEPTI